MEAKETKSRKKGGKIAAGCAVLAVVIIIILLLTRCGGVNESAMSAGELAELLAAPGDGVITLDADVVVDGPLTIVGSKTIEGEGTIVLNTALEGTWPDTDAPTWGMGCAKLKAEDAAAMPAVFLVEDGASLTLGGGITVDANNNGNGILLGENGKLTISDGAVVKNGRYANLVVSENASAALAGGELLDGNVHNVINYGTVDLTGTNVSGALAGAAIYTTGTVEQSGGNVANAVFHNVYVAAGTYNMTGGTNDGAAKDGIVVAKDAHADVTGGSITNCIHGLCNNGTMNCGAITLSECGIMNNETGVLDLQGTTVDISEVYCLANNGGTVNAVDFTANKCDTCAVYNFSGDMTLTNLTVTGSRDGNISNAGGNMTVDGAVLDVCRDKSVTVGNGKAVLTNVQILGTTNNKYGVYAFGGLLVLSDSSIENVSSSAVKVDAGSSVELNNVTIKDAEQNGFQSDGGKIVGTNVSMQNMGSHGIYNNGGDITVDGLTIDTVTKNGLQHKSGTTTLSGLDASNMGNHGAYVEKGTVTVTDSALTGMKGNGFYLPAGDSQLILENVTVTDTVQQGINNSASVSVKNVSISKTGMNAIYNKEGGTVTVDGLEIADVAEHGINNKADMTVKNVTVKNTGDGSNGIQNNGTMTLSGAAISNSKNHGLYNTGDLDAENVTIKGTADNGVYNNKGDAMIAGLTISSTGTQGVNNNSTITLENVTVTGAGSNGIYNSDGKAAVTGLKVNSAGEHGINNVAEMTLTNAAITGTGEDKNGIQNTGKLTVDGVEITESLNHGIYNKGTISGSDVTVTGTDDNGIYNADGTIDALAGLNISRTGSQGVNNTGIFNASDVDISATGKNGIYNNGGTATVTGLSVTNPGEHGVSNNNGGVVTLTGANLNGSGTGSNCIQNKAVMTVSGVTASNSSNHGIYNDSSFTSTGDLVVTGSAKIGIYNYGGTVNLANTTVSAAGGHGINNTGTLTGATFAVSGVAENGFQNTGSMTVTGSALITDSGKHGVYNGKTFLGSNITVTNAYDLLASNAGDMEVHGMKLSGTAHKALYNSGYAELYTVTVDGSLVTNGGSAEYLVDNNGGILDLTDATLVDSNGTALQNRGNAAASVTNVVIDGAGNYGIFVEGGCVLSGDGLVVNNITKNEGVKNAEGFAIKNQGKITMMDHVTLGDYDDGVTGDGATPRKSTSGIYSTALTNDATTASYSGFDLVIRNALGGNGIYNKGKVFVTDLVIDEVKDGLVTRYTSWATLSGTVTISNVTRNPISVYGPESGGYVNGITLTSGSSMTLENAGSHAINNKGSFLAAADTSLTIRNIVGKNINAINNQSGAKMTLGDVTVDGLYVTISMYNETTINSNSGNGIQSNSALELNGDVVISNLFYNAANGKTDNSNGSGVVVKNGGSITGTGSITVIGSQTAPAGYEDYSGLFNGIFTTKCTIDVDGDISVSDAKNQGIYVADDKASLSAGNITVTNIGGNGLYINNKGGKVEAADITIDNTGNHGLQSLGKVYAADITVSNVAGANQGIYVRDGGSYMEASSVTVKNVPGGNGIYVNNASGKLIVSGAISIENVGQHGMSSKGTVEASAVTIKDVGTSGAYNGIENTGTVTVTGAIEIANTTKRGLNSSGTVSAGSLTISGFAENGIQNSGTLSVSGAITVSNGTGRGHGIYSSKKLTAGSVSVADVTRNGINNAGEFTVSGEVSVKNAVEGGIGSNKTFSAGAVTVDTVTAGPGINNSGSFTVTGLTSVKNITGTDVNAIQNKNTMTLGDVVIDGVKITVGKDDEGKDKTNVGNGINNEKSLTINGTASITNVFTSVKGNSVGAGVNVIPGAVVSGSGSLVITGSASSDEAYPYGINNGIFLDGASMNLGGSITVSNVTNQGIYAANENASLTAGDITVKNVNGNGIYINKASGALNVSGTVTIDGTNNHGLSNFGTTTAGNITIKNIPNKNGLENGGSVTVSGVLSVSNIAKGYGIHNNGGTVQAATIIVDNCEANTGIFLEGNATLKGYDVTVSNINHQAIQANHANTIEIQTLTITNVTKNGLRLYNNSGNPTVTIGTLVASECAEYALAAQKELTSDNLTVGVVYYENCVKGAVHGNIKSGVGQVISGLPTAEAAASAEETEI